jgi:hypothetical protein
MIRFQHSPVESTNLSLPEFTVTPHLSAKPLKPYQAINDMRETPLPLLFIEIYCHVCGGEQEHLAAYLACGSI